MGYLVYGPYRKFPGGPLSVAVSLRARAASPHAVVAKVDIWDGKSKQVLYQRDLRGAELVPDQTGWTSVRALIDVPESNKLEFRVYAMGNSEMDAVSVETRPGSLYGFYARESVELAALGGKLSGPAGSNDLEMHRRWAMTQSPQELRDELRDKIQTQRKALGADAFMRYEAAMLERARKAELFVGDSGDTGSQLDRMFGVTL
jgi:hypothetical protein